MILYTYNINYQIKHVNCKIYLLSTTQKYDNHNHNI